MKKPIFLFVLAISGLANAAIYSWEDDFESYDTAVDNLEGQTVGGTTEWLTDPIGTTAIAVDDNSAYGVGAGFGSKSLIVGVTSPVGEDTPGVSWLTPLADPHFPSTTPPEVETQFVMDFHVALGPGSSSLEDYFRLTFVDSNDASLATVLIAPSGSTGIFQLFRSNMVETFDTSVIGLVETDFTLDVRMNRGLNKWSASLTQIGGFTVNLFADVQMQGDGLVAEADFGGFYIDWLKADGAPDWGDNALVVDNVSVLSLEPIPEPSVSLLAGFGVLLLWRRCRDGA